MKAVNEYDVRQIKLMNANLVAFETGKITLDSLIGTLKFLLSVLEFIDKSWQERFLDEFTTLETINAIAT